MGRTVEQQARADAREARWRQKLVERVSGLEKENETLRVYLNGLMDRMRQAETKIDGLGRA